MKTTTWICDSCGTEIEDSKHGWIEWLAKIKGEGSSLRGLRLVHHGGEGECQYNGNFEYQKDGYGLSDMPLENFLGSDGLMELLSLLSEDNAPKDEIIEMIKRLHIPGYEHARVHFKAAIRDGIFEPNTKPGFYRADDIEATLDWVKSQE